jgi:addiction module HigA family antidote
MTMFNPAHPGRIVRQCMGKLTVTAFAEQIGIPRAVLSGILNSKQSITPEIAEKLGQAFPNQDAALWLRLQDSYDHAPARKQEALHAAIKEGEESGIAPAGVFERVIAELQDPGFDQTMETARKVMGRRRGALRELAK